MSLENDIITTDEDFEKMLLVDDMELLTDEYNISLDTATVNEDESLTGLAYGLFETLRIGSWNILNKEISDARYGKIVRCIREKNLDVVALQEVVDLQYLDMLMKPMFPYSHISVANHKDEYNVVYSRYPIFAKDGYLNRNPMYRKPLDYLNQCAVKLDNTVVYFYNVHLAWGNREAERLRQMETIDLISDNYDDMWVGDDTVSVVHVLLGDCNALPDSRSIRFMKGLDVSSRGNSSTLWVDAWESSGSNPDTWVTTDHANNEYGINSAHRNGILHAEFTPKRRVDYILVKGFAYGRIGSPILFDYIHDNNGEALSDHNGIMCELLLT